MENLESQSQDIDLSIKIKSIYDKLNMYTSKRGSKDEAIDIINGDLVFSEEAFFVRGKDNSFEVTLTKINLKDDQLEGQFKLGLSNSLDAVTLELIEEYVDFLEIDYQVKLNIQDIESLIQQIVNMIECFTIISNENYKVDLGEEGLIVMSGWRKIYLHNEEKKQYIKGALLKIEDNSEYITRISKQDDTYILYGQDGSEARLFIRSKRLVLESDFIYAAKLPKYIKELNKYLFNDYLTVFGENKKPVINTVSENNHRVRRTLINVISTEGITSLFNKEVWYKEDNIKRFERMREKLEKKTEEIEKNKYTITEDIRGNLILEEEKEKEQTKDISIDMDVYKMSYKSENEQTRDISIDVRNREDFAEIRKKLEGELKDEQLLLIINKCLDHIERKIYTIERYKKETRLGQKSDSKIKKMNNITKSIFEINLLSIYKYYKEYIGDRDTNISYIKNKIGEKLDIQGLGFYYYFTCGNTTEDYSDHNDESYRDVAYSSNGNNILATINGSEQTVYDIQSDRQNTSMISYFPLRRYSRNSNYEILSEGKDRWDSLLKYQYIIRNLDDNKTIMNILAGNKEEENFVRRGVYDLIDDYLLVIGDKKLRIMEISDNDDAEISFPTISIYSEDYTIATESTKLFSYSKNKLVVYDISDEGTSESYCFLILFGGKVKVNYMHAREGQVKIIYMQDGELKYSCYKEDDLLENFNSVKPIVSQNITSLNNINLVGEMKKAELFFSEDNQYAIFVKGNTIYTLYFTEQGVELFVTDAIEFNHVFKVKYSPNGREAILRDGSTVYKLDLDLIRELQTNNNSGEELELLDERKKLVEQIQYIHNRKLLEEQEKKE